DLRTATPDLAAIVPVGGWPMFAPEGFKAFASKSKKDIDAGKFTLVVADTLKMQLELLRDGYANALVGQRPFEMGEKSMDTLLAIKKGQKVPEIIYTGLDLVTKDNVSTMLRWERSPPAFFDRYGAAGLRRAVRSGRPCAPGGTMNDPILEMRGVSKSFSGIKALRAVDLTVYAGEIHALMGENGAGKSTLMKILSGAYRPDPGGEIRIEGKPVRIEGP